MIPSRVEVLVVGGGPAGAVAAQVLASAGRSVLLLEQERLPRYKTCGGGVIARAFDALPFPAPTAGDLPMTPIRRVRVSGPGGSEVVVEREAPILAMAMRSDFDHWLVRQACAAGAELRDGVRVRDTARDGDGFACETDQGTVRARVVIAADGAESRLARQVPGARGRAAARLGPALEGELKEANGRSADARSSCSDEARFDFGVAVAGYGWVFPKAGRLSAGVFTRSSRAPWLRASYRRYLADRGLGSGAAVEERLTGHRIPIAPCARPAQGGLLLTGDAAGFADPLSGEGISWAIRSGRLAAESVLAAGARPERAEAEYLERLGRCLLPELRCARLAATILYGGPTASFALFRRNRRLADALVDQFLGRRSYRDLVRRIATGPWRLILPRPPAAAPPR